MAQSIANRGYVLETGRIVLSAPAHELLETMRQKGIFRRLIKQVQLRGSRLATNLAKTKFLPKAFMK
jgi:ABC-type oligopeptide transport system ATPase subunit